MPQDPILVEVEGMGTVEFPAGTSPAQIQVALLNARQMAKKDPTLWDRFLESAKAGNPMRTIETISNNLALAGGTIGGIAGAVAGGPVGAIGGAALGGAGGSGFQQVIDAARGRPTPTTELGAVKQMATDAAVQGGAQAIGAGAGKVMAKGAPWLMQKALKPTATALAEYKTTAPRVVQTLLDEGINVTSNGVAKLQKLFDATNAEIKAALQSRHDILGRLGVPQDVIGKKTVAARALTTANKISQQVNPSSDLTAVGGVVEDFINHPRYTGNLTLPEAQAMKVGTYRKIGDAYGEMSSAQKEATKALARGLKEEIAAEVPTIAPLNARDSQLMAALDMTGQRVAQAGNRDPVGFAWVTQSPVTFLAALFDRSPAIKSLVARGLYTHAGKAAKVSPDAIRLAVAAIAQSGSPEPDAEPPPP